jgi:uroporphyrinogen-III synthase
VTESIDQTMAGCTVLLTADRRAAELGAALKRRGATIRYAPAMSIAANEDDAHLIAGTRELITDPPDILVVTTGIGFRGWIDAADAIGLGDALTVALGSARIVARGPKARGAIQAAGLQADWVAESETSREIAEVLLDEGVQGLKIAVQHHGAGSDGLDAAFRAAGADVRSLVVYRWGPPVDPQALEASVHATASGEIDTVVFTSAPGSAAWLAAADAAGVTEPLVEQFRCGAVVAAAVGATTAEPLVRRGIAPIVPDRGRLGSLVRTIVAHYGDLQTLDTVAGQLQVRRRAAVLDRHILPLSPTGIEVLRLLASAQGDVVLRSAVLAALPGASQDPHAAEVAIARLREATGSRDLIRTVVKRGYRIAIAELPTTLKTT